MIIVYKKSSVFIQNKYVYVGFYVSKLKFWLNPHCFLVYLVLCINKIYLIHIINY